MTASSLDRSGSTRRDAIQEQLPGTGVAVSAIVGSIQLLDADPQKRAHAIELDRRRLFMAKALGADFVIEVLVFGAINFTTLEPNPPAPSNRAFWSPT
jgi:sugar phosphate isomerase/epimerase